MDSQSRTRTYTWQDPLPGYEQSAHLSGLEYLQKLASGELSFAPMGQTLNYRLVEIEEGFAAFEGEAGEYCYNPIGVVHGGFAMTILDSVLACAIQTRLPAGMAYTTVQININLIRAITQETGKVRAEAHAIHVGRQMGTSEGTLKDMQGKLLAHGTTTCLIFPRG
jgi:uncharacterized protein (TIGR00369 family)